MKEKDSYILLVWWFGDIQYYLLPQEELTKEQLKILHAMGGKFCGNDFLPDKEDEKIALMVCDPETYSDEWVSSSDMAKYIGLFWKYKVENTGFFRVDNIKFVVTSGQEL